MRPPPRHLSEIYQVVIDQAITPTVSEQTALATARRFGSAARHWRPRVEARSVCRVSSF